MPTGFAAIYPAFLAGAWPWYAIRVTALAVPVLIGVTQIATAAGEEDHTEGIQIRLDYTPFNTPNSAFVYLQGQGGSHFVEYSAPRLIVLALRQGMLSDSQTASIFSSTKQADFEAALRTRSFVGSGLKQGDQFWLAVSHGSEAVRECFGFVEDTPPIVRTAISDMLKLKGKLAQARLAHAYLRSAPIEKERQARLLQRRRQQFASLSDLQPDVRSIALQAIQRPRDFLAVEHKQYGKLKKVMQGSEMFVMHEDGSGHQLTLFETQPLQR